jgi:hypothetical protein
MGEGTLLFQLNRSKKVKMSVDASPKHFRDETEAFVLLTCIRG